MGHQLQFFKTNWKHHYAHGGALRKLKLGRSARPLSNKEPLHVVFKVDHSKLRYRSLRSARSFNLIHILIKQVASMSFVKIEQLSIQNDHIHLLVRASRRTQFHYFFRVLAGQIAQRLQKEGLLVSPARQHVTDTPKHSKNDPKKEPQNVAKKPQEQQRLRDKGTKLWKYRPFSRVVRGWKAYKTARNYIQLNEKEARGEISYRKTRLKGLSSQDWEVLWI